MACRRHRAASRQRSAGDPSKSRATAGQPGQTLHAHAFFSGRNGGLWTRPSQIGLRGSGTGRCNAGMQSQVLVIDVGSTRLKAALYTESGAETAAWSADSPLRGTVVSPPAVLDAVLQAADHLCAGMRPDAIAITGATRSHVLTAADASALDSLVKLDDPRGAAFEPSVQQAYAQPGARGMGAFHPLARLLDHRATQPAIHAAAKWQLELKDWLNLQLTGVAATDAVTHHRLAPRHTTLASVMQQLGLRADLLPAPTPAGTVLAPLRAGQDPRLAGWQGVPVVQCGFDAWCASYGMGCVRDRHVYNVSGTTEVFGSFSTGGQPLEGIGSLQWTPELFHLGGPCLTGLSTLAWFGRTFLGDSDPQGVLDCAAQAGSDSPDCLPFVSGERMPFWRADLSAQFIGVRSHHGLPEMARALVDGLMAFQRYLVSLMCPDAGRVHLSGGATGLKGWGELKAAMFGMPVAICTLAEPSLLGGAMSALAAIGRYPSLAAAQDALAPGYLTIAPDSAAIARIRAAEQRLLPHFHRIARP
ncbi:MAG: hypothetical protein EOO54_09365 [Haliea sp.]|nr:MAG: hypothetical protein EOO54_09365 [Haliea sp.]